MALRIKEVCKEKKMTMAQVAEKIGINPITLSQSINGNPTLGRLAEVANALGVDVSDLFERNASKDIHGCIYVNGKAHLIASKVDLEILLRTID